MLKFLEQIQMILYPEGVTLDSDARSAGIDTDSPLPFRILQWEYGKALVGGRSLGVGSGSE